MKRIISISAVLKLFFLTSIAAGSTGMNHKPAQNNAFPTNITIKNIRPVVYDLNNNINLKCCKPEQMIINNSPFIVVARIKE